jgi:hypothetical protein
MLAEAKMKLQRNNLQIIELFYLATYLKHMENCCICSNEIGIWCFKEWHENQIETGEKCRGGENKSRKTFAINHKLGFQHLF